MTVMLKCDDLAMAEVFRYDHPRWNGIPCAAQFCTVIVGDDGRFPQPWFKEFVGTQREAIRVRTHPEMGSDEWDRTNGASEFYIDNEDGGGYAKLMNGGGPSHGHATLIPERVVAWGLALPGSQ